MRILSTWFCEQLRVFAAICDEKNKKRTVAGLPTLQHHACFASPG
jgi:hypothetical protein